jgi:hypothetical protein
MLSPASSISLSSFSLLLPPHDPPIQIFSHREEEMASKSPPPSKRRRWEHDKDESHHQKKLEKGKDPATKEADEELFFDDTKFAVELLRSAFRKLEDVGATFDIKAHHDVYKDPSVKGLTFRIHGLAEKLEKLPVVRRATHRHFVFDDGGSDGNDSSHGDSNDNSSHDGDDGGTPTVCALLCLRQVVEHELLSLSIVMNCLVNLFGC